MIRRDADHADRPDRECRTGRGLRGSSRDADYADRADLHGTRITRIGGRDADYADNGLFTGADYADCARFTRDTPVKPGVGLIPEITVGTWFGGMPVVALR